MEFFEAVEKRYTHKEKFLPDAVPLEALEKIAKAGLAAPTGQNKQCVRLVILSGREEIQALCDVSPTPGLETAPAAIAVLTDSNTQSDFHNFELEDYSAATENMVLAVTALGYVTVWLDALYFDKEKNDAAIKVLGAPEGYQMRVVLPVGLPDGPGSRREKMAFDERVSYGKFGGHR